MVAKANHAIVIFLPFSCFWEFCRSLYTLENLLGAPNRFVMLKVFIIIYSNQLYYFLSQILHVISATFNGELPTFNKKLLFWVVFQRMLRFF